MFTELKNVKLPNNVYINPQIINKNRFHGSLTHGIISNIRYANVFCKYKYCIILSARTIFYKNLKVDNLICLTKKWNTLDDIQLTGETPNNWHWPTFKTTLLSKHYLTKNYKLYNSAHEGLALSYNITQNIIHFLNCYPDIENNIINFNSCVEEFALQTIASNEINNNNLEYGYIELGHGVDNGFNINIPNKYTYKINFI